MSSLQDHLSELIRGQELPLPALDHSHIEIILELLHQAYIGIKADYPTTVAAADEKQLNSLMVDRLNNLVREDPMAGLLVRAVSRGAETKNYDATRLEMRPDIQISLTNRQHLFPLIVECKLIDLANGKTVELYCRDGLSRFTTGDYAWTNREALMLAYVRGDGSTGKHLSRFLATAKKKKPPQYSVISLPKKCVASLPDAAKSDHGRYFTYVHGGSVGELPGDISVWHLWIA